MSVSMGERPGQKDFLRHFLKVATEVDERADSGKLFHREGAQELNDSRDRQSDSFM